MCKVLTFGPKGDSPHLGILKDLWTPGLESCPSMTSCVTLGKSLSGPCSVLLREITGEVRFFKKDRETLCIVLCTYEGLLFLKNIK